MRIRIKKKPAFVEMEEFDGRSFVVGETTEIPARLATLLIVGGYAEPAAERWEAADGNTATRHKKR